jgi:hypothetical protein
MHYRSRSVVVSFITCLILVSSVWAPAQIVVDSTYVGSYFEPYSEATNWSPSEVPNNTPERHYDVFLGPGTGVTVDIEATISNLTCAGGDPTAGLQLFGRTFTVTGTTSASRLSVAVNSIETTAAKFNGGTLSSFADGNLSGEFQVASYGTGSATLQLAGTQQLKLKNAQLTIQGIASLFLDENGVDRLSRLAEVDALSTFSLAHQTATTAVPLRIDGTLELGADVGDPPTVFAASASLTNFDPESRTVTGGIFKLGPVGSSRTTVVEFRFAGADIVNNGSTLVLVGEGARLVDMNGADGLRNFARNLPEASLGLQYKRMTVPGNFSNDGTLKLNSAHLTIAGSLQNFLDANQTLQGGIYLLDGERSPGEPSLSFFGANIVHNGASISLSSKARVADQSGNDGLRNFADNLSTGTFVLGFDQEFVASTAFSNAGLVETKSTRNLVSGGGFPADATFTVAGGADYVQTGGATVNEGTLTAGKVRIMGGSFSGAGTISGDVVVGQATTYPGGSIDGRLSLSPDATVRVRIGEYFSFSQWRFVSGAVVLSGTLEVEITAENFISSEIIFTVLTSGQPLTGTFANAPEGARIQTSDGSGSFVVRYRANMVNLTEFQASPKPAQLLNISSRAYVKPGDNVVGQRYLIGGFIITGPEPKSVIVRGLGPSLARFGLNPALSDPTIELHQDGVGLLASNDNWRDSQQVEIEASGLAPEDPREAAIKATLDPGSYTVVLQDRNGAPGTAMVEVYDISRGAKARLANISTLGTTDANNILIGGIIAGGDGPANAEVIVRAIGPTLRSRGVFVALQDPTLELRDSNGAVLAFNDDWPDNYEQLGSAVTDFGPNDSRECAMRVSLPHGSYTALVRGKNNSGGTALVEFYDLRR